MQYYLYQYSQWSRQYHWKEFDNYRDLLRYVYDLRNSFHGSDPEFFSQFGHNENDFSWSDGEKTWKQYYLLEANAEDLRQDCLWLDRILDQDELERQRENQREQYWLNRRYKDYPGFRSGPVPGVGRGNRGTVRPPHKHSRLMIQSIKAEVDFNEDKQALMDAHAIPLKGSSKGARCHKAIMADWDYPRNTGASRGRGWKRSRKRKQWM